MNPAGLRDRLGGAACDVWNPDGDPYPAARVLARLASEEGSTKTAVALRDQHRLLMTPIDRLPKTALGGRPLQELTGAFLTQFGALRYAPNTPRDLLLRGQYREATSALEDVKKTVDNARTRMDLDPTVQKDFDRWTNEFQTLTARVLRPDPNDPGGAEAKRNLEQFRNNPRNRDIERAFVLGNASRPLAAEVAFLMAQCVHERAERARPRGPPRPPTTGGMRPSGGSGSWTRRPRPTARSRPASRTPATCWPGVNSSSEDHRHEPRRRLGPRVRVCAERGAARPHA